MLGGAFERKLFFFVILGTFNQNFACIVPVIVLYRFQILKKVQN
jgi:hypothetical protein